MTAPWTPRERALREALEPFAAQCQEIENEAHMALQVGGYLPVDQPDISIDMWAAHGIKWRHLLAARAALADPPPPDPLDEALACSVCHGTGIERSGVCHCGAEMDGHSVLDNHGALEMERPCEFCTAHIQSKLAAATDSLNDAKKAFEEIQFECDGKADVEDDDSGIANRPNLAMRVEMIADNALTAIAAAKGEK